MQRKLAIAFLFISSLVVSSCGSRTVLQTVDGNYSGIIAEFESGNKTYSNSDIQYVYYLCNAYLNIGQYGKFKPCSAYVHEQIDRGATLEYHDSILSKRSILFFDISMSKLLGNHEETVQLGELAIKLSNQGFSVNNGPIQRFSVNSWANASIHADMAIALASLGHMEKANDHLDRALNPEDVTGWAARAAYEETRNYITPAISKLKRYEEAIDFLNGYDPGALIRLTGIGAEVSKASRNFEYARAYMGLNDHQNAAKHLTAFLAFPHAKDAGALYWIALHMLGQIHAEQGDLKDASENLTEALDKIEAQRSTLLASANKIGFVADKQKVYWDAAQTFIRLGDAAQAFETAERGKSRALVDLLASKSQFATQGDALVNTALMRDLEQLSSLSVALGDKPDLNDVRNRSLANETRRQELTKKTPELASLVSVSRVSLAEVQDRLTEDEALLEYYGHDQSLHAFVVTKTDINAVQLDGQALAKAVAGFRRDVQNVNGTDYRASSRTLYNRLIKPVAEFLKGERLTVVPHGPLHYLPFGALHDGSKYLIDQFDIRMLPSASVLRFIDNKTVVSQGLLAFGNPDLNDARFDLTGAQEETRAITASWPNSKILLRKHASETSFKRFAGQFKFLHLASHSQFNTVEPLKSKMLLSPDNDNDGNLTVDELYELHLNADLVTLSACDTGLGDIASGDDVIGLSRGFIYAGARSVVASLWPVADKQTALLMKRFYVNLQTMGKAKALRQAQIDTMKDFPHPIFWAAFQITGGG
jgi:CHAT domain-containing protein